MPHPRHGLQISSQWQPQFRFWFQGSLLRDLCFGRHNIGDVSFGVLAMTKAGIKRVGRVSHEAGDVTTPATCSREIKTFVLHLFRIQAALLNGFAHLSPKQGA